MRYGEQDHPNGQMEWTWFPPKRRRWPLWLAIVVIALLMGGWVWWITQMLLNPYDACACAGSRPTVMVQTSAGGPALGAPYDFPRRSTPALHP